MKALSRPPLMKFLKHNNKSRGRSSRPTPIFHTNPPSKIEISQDPSSPKVTCIGQVTGGGGAAARRREIKKPSSRICSNQGRGFRGLFRKWGLFFRAGKVDERESCGPQNQEILKRCKSVPYRSSSLGGLILAENEENSRIVQECSKKFGDLVDNGEDLEGIVGSTMHPLVLAKCKSETFRREERVLRRFG